MPSIPFWMARSSFGLAPSSNWTLGDRVDEAGEVEEGVKLFHGSVLGNMRFVP